MNKITTRPWDSAEHLETDEDIAAYLDAVLEEAGDDTAFRHEVSRVTGC